MKIRVVKRKITQLEAKLLVSEVKATPNIVGYSLKEWLMANHIMVAEDSKGFCLGACLNYDFHKDWRKIAALIVLEEFRGRGIGRMLFYESFRDAQRSSRNIYIISANPIVIKMMNDLGFITFNSFFELTHLCQNYESLFYCHTIQWTMSLYRIKEIIRKKIIYTEKQRFLFGVKFL